MSEISCQHVSNFNSLQYVRGLVAGTIATVTVVAGAIAVNSLNISSGILTNQSIIPVVKGITTLAAAGLLSATFGAGVGAAIGICYTLLIENEVKSPISMIIAVIAVSAFAFYGAIFGGAAGAVLLIAARYLPIS